MGQRGGYVAQQCRWIGIAGLKAMRVTFTCSSNDSQLFAKAQIHTLAHTLVRPLASVRGVAMALTILRDGSGPLFNPYSDRSLTDLLDQVIDLMNPLSSAYR